MLINYNKNSYLMKNMSFLILLFLISCSGNGNKQVEKEIISTTEASTDSVAVPVDQNLEPETEPKSESFTVKAQFIDFELGDASHYGFEDASGKHWDFRGCNSKTLDFVYELDEKEANESNQGWGSNKKLQGKWFRLTIVKVEQPEYIDGPITMADIIQEAVLIED
jgi:hypothetical protein